MKNIQINICKNIIAPCLIITTMMLLLGCTAKLVADYDDKIYKQTLSTAKLVDKFYISLLAVKEHNRKYQPYAKKYLGIENILRSLYSKNKSRKLNQESITISESILDLWIKYKTNHQSQNTYSNRNAQLDKNRLSRLFTSAANAESSKNTM